MPIKIGVLISGGGTNLQSIIDSIEAGDLDGEISLVVSNKPDAFGLERAKKHGISHKLIDFKEADDFDLLSENLKDLDLIVLAGFLVILPKEFVEEFSGKIINLHPSLLPKHGGDGMYGLNVHESVINSGENLSGATIHYVDEGTDTGEIIVQEMVNVYKSDKPEDLAERLSYVEHELIVEGIKRWKYENGFN